MKSFLSVFALTARSTLYKCMGIMATAAALETGIFFYHLKTLGSSMRLEVILDSMVYYIIICAALIGILFLMAFPFRGKSIYTITRLSDSEKLFAAAASLSNFCILLLGAAVQILLFWFFCKVYVNQTESVDAGHMAFLAFTRTPLMINFLPLTHPVDLLYHLLVLITLSLSAAYTACGRSFAALNIAVAFTVLQLNKVNVADLVLGLRAASYAAICIILIYLLHRPRPQLDKEMQPPGGELHA